MISFHIGSLFYLLFANYKNDVIFSYLFLIPSLTILDRGQLRAFTYDPCIILAGRTNHIHILLYYFLCTLVLLYSSKIWPDNNFYLVSLFLLCMNSFLLRPWCTSFFAFPNGAPNPLLPSSQPPLQIVRYMNSLKTINKGWKLKHRRPEGENRLYTYCIQRLYG